MVIVTVTLNTSLDRTLEVPGFAVGGHLRGRVVRVQPAGKGVNVSRCLARLGVPSVVSGLVGERELPLFEESLSGTAASAGLVPVADATRTNTTILDPELGTDTHIREAGFAVQPDELAALGETLAGLASDEAVFAFCGSLPPGLSPARLSALFAVCAAGGGRLVADLNGGDLGIALHAGVLAAKPNVEELGEVVGRDLATASEGELVDAARGLCGRAGTLLVTRGADGALAVRPDGAFAAAADIEAPRNTVGCGDAFLAGYLAGLSRHEPLAECLRLAVACGAANALSDVAGEIDADRVAALARRARLREIGRG